MIHREVTAKILELAGQYPIVSVTGPRQSGKTTLVRAAFPEYEYLSFENPSVRSTFEDDPRSFLSAHGAHAIFDEAQRVPELFSYLQQIVDESGAAGQFVLTGSQDFLLSRSVSQSLAGRVALFTLPTLSYEELLGAEAEPLSLEEWLFLGGYPRLHDGTIQPQDFFVDYVQTYLERDVRAELGVRSLSAFRNFLQLCALRSGELLNMASLASDCGISANTAREWVSILEASHIVRLLRPYSSNRTKRLAKTPKLYLMDTGLMCFLCGLESPGDLRTSGMIGQVFETSVFGELVKRVQARHRVPQLSFWRDSHKQEIDLLVEKGPRVVRAIECKASTTYNSRFFDTLDKVGREDLGLGPEALAVVYGGDEALSSARGSLVPYRSIGTLLP